VDLTLQGSVGRLEAWLASPESDFECPGVVVVPGFPTDPGGGGANSYNTFPGLADRICQAISDPAFPPDFNRWAKELQEVSTVRAAEKLTETTALLVLHGSNDDAVPPLDARAIADAHGLADLRIIEGARHHLRHDPRAMAIAVGWLDRRGSSPTSR